MKKQVSMKTKKLIPLFDNVLIEPQEQENKTKSGLLLPDSAKEKPQIGKVIAVGPGKPAGVREGTIIEARYFKTIVKTGDVVLYKKWSGTEHKHEGKEYVIIKEEDILAVEE